MGAWLTINTPPPSTRVIAYHASLEIQTVQAEVRRSDGKKMSHRVPPFEFFEIDTDPSCTFDVLLMNRGITGFTVSRTSAVSEVNGDFGLKTQMFPNLRVERSYCPKKTTLPGGEKV